MEHLFQLLMDSNSFGLYEKIVVTYIAWKFAGLAKDVHWLRNFAETSGVRLTKLEEFKDKVEKFMSRFGSTNSAP